MKKLISPGTAGVILSFLLPALLFTVPLTAHADSVKDRVLAKARDHGGVGGTGGALALAAGAGLQANCCGGGGGGGGGVGVVWVKGAVTGVRPERLAALVALRTPNWGAAMSIAVWP